MNWAKSRRNERRRGCRRRQRGGAGEGYNFGGPVAGAHIINNYDGTVKPYASCNEAVRPGYITGAAAEIRGGLPGFGSQRGGRGAFTTGATQVGSQMNLGAAFGGGRRSRRNRRNRRGSRKQRGGRYSFVPEVVNGVGIMEPRYSGCGEGLAAVQNPLNKDAGFPGSVLTAPPPQVPIPTPMGMKGGARRGTRKQRGGVYGHEAKYASDAMVYEAPRSGYTTVPSIAVGAGTLPLGGVGFLVNQPYSAQPQPSNACLKTGGGRKSRKNRKSRKSRKSRKGGRK